MSEKIVGHAQISLLSGYSKVSTKILVKISRIPIRILTILMYTSRPKKLIKHQ